MKLKEFNIELMTYGEFRGRYVGKIAFEDSDVGSVCMTIDPDMAQMLLAACADKIVAMTTKTAQNLQRVLEASIAEARQGPALTA